MSTIMSVAREIELISRAIENKKNQESLKNKKEEADGDKSAVIKAEKEWDPDKIATAARELDTTLNKFEHDLNTLESRMHEDGLDSEFNTIKRELRDKLSSFLSY